MALRDALTRYADILRDNVDENEAAIFLDQIGTAAIRELSNDRLSFEVSANTGQLRTELYDSTLTGVYRDEDGVYIVQILHFVNHKIAWEERFRVDSGDLLLRYPGRNTYEIF